jgi:hypothetical protein
LVAAVGIELGKKLLTVYLGQMPTYSAIYGAFAAVPILLVWIYMAWVIVLVGAVVAAPGWHADEVLDLAAAVEADLGTVPLLLLSADRPGRLKNCGANQAVPQEQFLAVCCRWVGLGASDGLAQMAEWAATHSGYDAVHVLSHGSLGQLTLGSAVINRSSLDAADAAQTQRSNWAAIGQALTTDGDLLLYGCSIGADGLLIDRIAELTQADLAASTNATGAAQLGGDWTLKVAFLRQLSAMAPIVGPSTALRSIVPGSFTHTSPPSPPLHRLAALDAVTVRFMFVRVLAARCAPPRRAERRTRCPLRTRRP